MVDLIAFGIMKMDMKFQMDVLQVFLQEQHKRVPWTVMEFQLVLDLIIAMFKMCPKPLVQP